MLTHEELHGIDIHLLKVTPEIAAEFLSRNTAGQRSLSEPNVEKYGADMVTGEWHFTGAPILFNFNNELIDGQHRLKAIIASNEPQILLIIRGVDPDAMVAIDTGRRRSYANILQMRKIKNSSAVAALASRVAHWDMGNYGCRGVPRRTNAKFTSSLPSNAQKDAVTERYEKAYGITFEAAAKFAVNAYAARPGISVSTYALGWTILSGINKDLRELYFHELLVESRDPKSGYPITALTNRLARLKGNETLDNVDQLDALFSVFNAWAKGTRMEIVRPPRPVRPGVLAIPDGFEELA